MVLTYVQFRDLYLQCFNASEPNSGWPARAQYQDLAQGGAYRLWGSERAPRDKKVEKRRWMLVASDATLLDAAYADLKNEIGYAGRLLGVAGSGLGMWTDAELLDARAVGAPRPISGRMRGVGLDIETSFMLNTPSWYGETIESLTFSDIYDTGGGDLLLLLVVGATPGTVVPMTWFVEGAAATGRITITLHSGTGGGSGVTKLLLQNTTTGYTLQWDGVLPAGDDLVIVVNTETITNEGVDAYDELTLGAHTRWFELAPGVNSVNVQILDTATDDSTVLTVAYYPAYP